MSSVIYRRPVLNNQTKFPVPSKTLNPANITFCHHKLHSSNSYKSCGFCKGVSILSSGINSVTGFLNGNSSSPTVDFQHCKSYRRVKKHPLKALNKKVYCRQSYYRAKPYERPRRKMNPIQRPTIDKMGVLLGTSYVVDPNLSLDDYPFTRRSQATSKNQLPVLHSRFGLHYPVAKFDPQPFSLKPISSNLVSSSNNSGAASLPTQPTYVNAEATVNNQVMSVLPLPSSNDSDHYSDKMLLSYSRLPPGRLQRSNSLLESSAVEAKIRNDRTFARQKNWDRAMKDLQSRFPVSAPSKVILPEGVNFRSLTPTLNGDKTDESTKHYECIFPTPYDKREPANKTDSTNTIDENHTTKIAVEDADAESCQVSEASGFKLKEKRKKIRRFTTSILPAPLLGWWNNKENSSVIPESTSINSRTAGLPLTDVREEEQPDVNANNQVKNRSSTINEINAVSRIREKTFSRESEVQEKINRVQSEIVSQCGKQNPSGNITASVIVSRNSQTENSINSGKTCIKESVSSTITASTSGRHPTSESLFENQANSNQVTSKDDSITRVMGGKDCLDSKIKQTSNNNCGSIKQDSVTIGDDIITRVCDVTSGTRSELCTPVPAPRTIFSTLRSPLNAIKFTPKAIRKQYNKSRCAKSPPQPRVTRTSQPNNTRPASDANPIPPSVSILQDKSRPKISNSSPVKIQTTALVHAETEEGSDSEIICDSSICLSRNEDICLNSVKENAGLVGEYTKPQLDHSQIRHFTPSKMEKDFPYYANIPWITTPLSLSPENVEEDKPISSTEQTLAKEDHTNSFQPLTGTVFKPILNETAFSKRCTIPKMLQSTSATAKNCIDSPQKPNSNSTISFPLSISNPCYEPMSFSAASVIRHEPSLLRLDLTSADESESKMGCPLLELSYNSFSDESTDSPRLQCSETSAFSPVIPSILDRSYVIDTASPSIFDKSSDSILLGESTSPILKVDHVSLNLNESLSSISNEESETTNLNEFASNAIADSFVTDVLTSTQLNKSCDSIFEEPSSPGMNVTPASGNVSTPSIGSIWSAASVNTIIRNPNFNTPGSSEMKSFAKNIIKANSAQSSPIFKSKARRNIFPEFLKHRDSTDDGADGVSLLSLNVDFRSHRDVANEVNQNKENSIVDSRCRTPALGWKSRLHETFYNSPARWYSTWHVSSKKDKSKRKLSIFRPNTSQENNRNSSNLEDSMKKGRKQSSSTLKETPFDSNFSNSKSSQKVRLKFHIYNSEDQCFANYNFIVTIMNSKL